MDGVLSKPCIIASSDLVQLGPLDGKPVVVLQFESLSNGAKSQPIILQADDAQTTIECMTSALATVRSVESKNAL